MIFNICGIAGIFVRLLVIAFILLPISSSKAEEKESDSVNTWVTAGLGLGFPIGLASIASANLRYKDFIVGARVAWVANVAGGLDFFNCTDEMTEKALLFGVASKILGPYIAVSIGVSEVRGTICHDISGKENMSSFGVPIDIQLLPKRQVGFAVRGFANINSDRTVWGITLNLALGNLR